VIGQTLAHYRIVEKIGEGGMGVVYRAHDESLDRDVALKVLPASSYSDPAARARLLREARTASQLNHPNICTIHEVGEAQGQTYIAMEFLEGQPLSARLAKGALPAEQVLRYGQQLADALAHAHERGVIHRDLKSANVMITPEGRAKVLDFGLAKRCSGEELDEVTRSQLSLTAPGALVGTLAYMAPEQLRGQPADARSDIWALGVVLYEMAAGARPFQAQTGFALTSAILNQAPQPLPSQVPTESKAVIERCLEKEPGLRYQRAGEVRAVLEAIEAGAVPPWVAWRYTLSRRRWLAPALATVVLLLSVAGLNFNRLRTLLGGMPGVQSLAVLPLENLSGDAEQDYLAAGVHEALITDLAKLGGLRRVIARTSVLRYRKADKPLPQIARELGVDALITGSVLRSGNRVQVTAHLIQAATEQQLWADRYERELRDVLSLQNDIVAAITRAIRLQLTPQEQARLARARPVNAEAYEAYLKGKFYLNKMTPEGYEKGLGYLNQAIERDPTNPMPYAALALGYSIIGHERDVHAFERARAAARKAEELGGEGLAEMYLAFGMNKLYSDWDYAGAEKDLRRAMELNPTLGEAHRDYSWYLFLIGRREEALAKMKRAQEVDPLTPLFYADRGWQYWWVGQNDKAMEEARKSLELDPNFNFGLYVLGVMYAEKGMYAEAIAAHQKLGAVDSGWKWGLARTYAQAGRRDEARKVLAEFSVGKPTPTGAWAGWFLAEAYAALGDKDEAFRWLEAAYKERHSFLPWLAYNPAYAPLRDDPRFADLVRRMHVPR
jgi:serine/threonine protein kinase/tetratricopeptide (TPR) repeat protein